MKKIQFTTKSLSNRLQQEEYLALTYERRMSMFFHSLGFTLSKNMSKDAMEAHAKLEKQKNNFIIGQI